VDESVVLMYMHIDELSRGNKLV